MTINAIAFSMPALADQVALKNGDKISGQVLTYAKGICLFDSQYGGLMKLPYEQIVGLSIDKPVQVVFGEEEQLSGVLKFDETSQIITSKTVGEVRVSIADISLIRRDFAEEKAELKKELKTQNAKDSYGEEASEPTLDFLRGSTVLLKDGQQEFSLGFRYNRNRYNYPTMFNSNDIINTTSRRIDTVLGYSIGLKNNLELLARAPLVYTHVKDVSSNEFVRDHEELALGDIQLGAQYLIKPQSFDWPSISWSVQLSAPTGKKLDYEYPEDWKNLGSTGGGSWAVSTGLDFTKMVDPIVLFGGVSLTHVNDFTVNGQEVESGKALGAYYGLGFAVNDKLSLSSRLSWNYYGNTRLDGIEMQGSDSEQIDLGLGLSYRMNPSLTVTPNLMFGLGSEASTSALSMNFAWKI